MGEIQNVIVLGATGTVGRSIVAALVAGGFTVTVGTRQPLTNNPVSTHNFPNPVTIKTVDLGNVPSLAAAFAGQDAVVEAFNPIAAHCQVNVVEAALQSSVKHIITPDFGSDTFHKNTKELRIFEPKVNAQKVLEESLKGSGIQWTAIIPGPFFDWAIPLGFFWVDGKEHKITLFGSGNQRVSMSRLDIVGRATVAVLALPEAYANRPAYFANYTLSTNELLGLLEDVSPGWKVENVSVENLLSEGLRQWDSDTANGVEDRLNSAAYMMLGKYGLFEEGNRFGADFGGKVEKGWEHGNEELQKDLRKLLSNPE